MKKICFVLLLFISLIKCIEVYGFDQPFDSFKSNIPWEEQRANLDNFAIYLQKNPESVGCINIHFEKTYFSKAKVIGNRLVKYLIKDHNIQKKRIRVIGVGNTEDSLIILQPIDKDLQCSNL